MDQHSMVGCHWWVALIHSPKKKSRILKIQDITSVYNEVVQYFHPALNKRTIELKRTIEAHCHALRERFHIKDI